jgi:hypothetical protein
MPRKPQAQVQQQQYTFPYLQCTVSLLCRHILGDKDTFGFAFAAARQLHRLHAVPLPPGVALRYELSGKPWQQQGKWHFNGMMQYDHLVRAAAAGCWDHALIK